MRSESISAAKDQLSALLREVQGGASILITDRGIPVAKLVPVEPTRGVSARLIGLAQQGLVNLPERPPSARWHEGAKPKTKRGASAVEALLREREASR